MSHAIDFDALNEKLFLLQQMCLASESYCRQEMIGSDLDIGDYAFNLYWGWVKGIVSNYLIECAIKTRLLQDYLTDRIEFNVGIADIDREARNGLEIGIIREGRFRLTIRESCNKIIHATKVNISWSENEVDGNVFKYWNGRYQLHGTWHGEDWHLELNVGNWAKAMSRYHQRLSEFDEYFYVGQDW